jgi:azurin
MIQVSVRHAPPSQNDPELHPLPPEQHFMLKLIALALLAVLSTPLMAAECATTIEGSDAMQFNQKTITVPKTCTSFAVTLKHTGKLPKTAMGHNWVLSHASDEAGVIADGMKAGASDSYEKPGDARIIAHTRLIGGGESDTATIDVAKLKAGEQYAYFCTFPGHAALMKGTLSLGK